MRARSNSMRPRFISSHESSADTDETCSSCSTNVRSGQGFRGGDRQPAGRVVLISPKTIDCRFKKPRVCSEKWPGASKATLNCPTLFGESALSADQRRSRNSPAWGMGRPNGPEQRVHVNEIAFWLAEQILQVEFQCRWTRMACNFFHIWRLTRHPRRQQMRSRRMKIPRVNLNSLPCNMGGVLLQALAAHHMIALAADV
jgi:hypothetical protein